MVRNTRLNSEAPNRMMNTIEVVLSVLSAASCNLASESSLAAILGQLEDEERLHQALSKLDDESRDLIALHSGNLPLVDVAELLARDRKTVRKRLQLALRRLEVLVGRGDAPEPVQRPSTPPRPPSERPAVASGFGMRLLTDDPALTVGLIADVVAVIGSNDVVMGDCDR